jgi:FMN phosphatase YigB (HAD superfamily)
MPPATAPQLSGVRYISFDLYGTLLRYDDLDRSWQDWQARLHLHLVRHGMQLSMEDFQAACRRFFQGNLAPLEGLSVLERRILQLAERCGVTLPAGAVSGIADECCHAWQQSITPDPESPRALAALAERFPLFLVSNFDHPRHVRRLLEELGLAGFFQEILLSGEQGVKKPDATLFAGLREKYRIGPFQCAHVGDSIEDYHFAVNTEMVPVMLGEERRINGSIDFMENEACLVSGAHHAASLKHVVAVLSDSI